MLEKFFVIIWFIVAAYDVLETFVFPKFLGEENDKIDKKFSRELAQDFLELQTVASDQAARKIIILIVVFSAMIPLGGFFIAYNSGIFSGVYEKILYFIMVVALIDIIFAINKTVNLAGNFYRKRSVDDLTNDLVKLSSKNSILHIIASAGTFIISFRLAIEILFRE